MSDTILRIDSSPRRDGSVTRRLSDGFVAKWLGHRPHAEIITRDIGQPPLQPIDDAWITSAFTPPERRDAAAWEKLRLSDELIEELFRADVYVLGSPVHNLTISATVKAYIDHVVRVGQTFIQAGDGLEGLLEGKRVLAITASGGVFRPGRPTAALNHFEPYLRSIFGFIGIADVHIVSADGLAAGEEAHEAGVQRALGEIDTLVRAWAAASDDRAPEA